MKIQKNIGKNSIDCPSSKTQWFFESIIYISPPGIPRERIDQQGPLLDPITPWSFSQGCKDGCKSALAPKSLRRSLKRNWKWHHFWMIAFFVFLWTINGTILFYLPQLLQESFSSQSYCLLVLIFVPSRNDDLKIIMNIFLFLQMWRITGKQTSRGNCWSLCGKGHPKTSPRDPRRLRHQFCCGTTSCLHLWSLSDSG